MEILIFLIRKRHEILGKSEIFNSVWAESFVEETNLTQHIYRIRKALEDTENGGTYIETVPKQGYRFIAEVKELPSMPMASKFGDETSEPLDNKDPDITDDSIASYLRETDVIASESINTSIDEVFEEKQTQTFIINKKVAIKVLIGAVLTLGILQIYFYYSANLSPTPIVYTSVAVFPFKYVGDNNDEKLELGVADTLISKLGNNEEFSVIPTESIVSYSDQDFQDSNHNLFEIGNKLGADIVLTGTIQRELNTVRYSVRYYSIKQKRQLCTMQFDEEFTDIFTLQDSISQKATQKLFLELKEHLNYESHLPDSN